MLDEALKKDRAIDRLIYDFGAYETKKEATKAVNSLLYWKKKYFALKKKLQELIDSKEE
jgi:hypothetical protein